MKFSVESISVLIFHLTSFFGHHVILQKSLFTSFFAFFNYCLFLTTELDQKLVDIYSCEAYRNLSFETLQSLVSLENFTF